MKVEQIVLGGGCFWCLHAAYTRIKGVTEVRQGYAGGDRADPSYEQVSMGTSGHAEVVEVTFDPAIISLADILDVFWTIHDPTTLNRQGPDVGPQYRSIILYSDAAQQAVIEKSREAAQAIWNNAIVTAIKPLEKFYPAEDYHYDYETSRPDYCQIIINPKLAKLRAKFTSLLQ